MWLRIRQKLKKLVEELSQPKRRAVRVFNGAYTMWVAATNGRLALCMQTEGSLGTEHSINVPAAVLPHRKQDLGQDIDRVQSNTPMGDHWRLDCKVQANETCQVDYNLDPYKVTGEVIPDVNNDYMPVTFDSGELANLLDVIGKNERLTFFIAPDAEFSKQARTSIPILISSEGVGVMTASGYTFPSDPAHDRYNRLREQYLTDSKQEISFQKPIKFDSSKLLQEMLGDD